MDKPIFRYFKIETALDLLGKLMIIYVSPLKVPMHDGRRAFILPNISSGNSMVFSTNTPWCGFKFHRILQLSNFLWDYFIARVSRPGLSAKRIFTIMYGWHKITYDVIPPRVLSVLWELGYRPWNGSVTLCYPFSHAVPRRRYQPEPKYK